MGDWVFHWGVFASAAIETSLSHRTDASARLLRYTQPQTDVFHGPDGNETPSESAENRGNLTVLQAAGVVAHELLLGFAPPSPHGRLSLRVGSLSISKSE